MTDSAADDWTAGFFDDPYTQLFPFPDAAQTEREVDATVELLPPPPARIFAVACGPGRHAIRLARRGFRVMGIDTSTRFLAEARAEAAESAADVEFVELDMRDVDFDREFDAALSLFTAWGLLRRRDESGCPRSDRQVCATRWARHHRCDPS
jgi:SAM-dependent methyltransferase